MSGARKDVLEIEADNPPTEDHGYTTTSNTALSDSAYVFLTCCAYGTNMCQRYGNFDHEVTANDEAFLVATYVYSNPITFTLVSSPIAAI